MAEGELLWSPDAAQIAEANLTAFTRWLRDERGLGFGDYDALWRWSVENLDAFWQAIWDYFDISASAPPAAVLGARAMPGAEWFPGARLNYAEHALRRAQPGAAALVYCAETSPLRELTTDDPAAQVRIVATRLRATGVRPGDRVAAYLPNIPEAVVAMLASVSIGAVWTSCSPDFGWRGVLDRLGQLGPVVLFTVEGYRYGGRWYDRTSDVARIAGALDTLRHVVVVDRGDIGDAGGTVPADGRVRWTALLDHSPVPAETFAFAQVPLDHPLWILFSSGTTGLPKAIVHGHGGILIEQLKLQHFHLDLSPGDRLFFFTTTGWMMWNFVVSALVLGVCPVLYDGNPTHPDPGMLWRIAQDARAVIFGASPSYVDLMSNAGVVPGAQYDLSSLRAVMPAGSPVSPAHTAWFYDNVARDLWVATGSGDTDVCTGFVGGVPTLPVYAARSRHARWASPRPRGQPGPRGRRLVHAAVRHAGGRPAARCRSRRAHPRPPAPRVHPAPRPGPHHPGAADPHDPHRKEDGVPVRRIPLGAPPEQAANNNTMAAPEALDAFVTYGQKQRDYAVG